MVSNTLLSTSSPNSYYKHLNGTFLGFLPQQDEMARPNDNHNFTMWLGQEDYFSSFSSNFGDIDDLVVPEIASFEWPLAYPTAVAPDFIISEGGNHDFLPALPECKVHTNSSSGYGEYTEESCYGVGLYDQVSENREDDVASSVFKNYNVFANNCAGSSMESSGIQGQINSPACGESNVKVGKYSAEERRARILRYLKKRNQRNFNKTIKYACRKALADRRVRIHGRFAKNHEDDQPQTNETVNLHDYNLATPYINTIDKNEEYYDDEWLQQAMASLMCVPYIPAWHGETIS